MRRGHDFGRALFVWGRIERDIRGGNVLQASNAIGSSGVLRRRSATPRSTQDDST